LLLLPFRLGLLETWPFLTGFSLSHGSPPPPFGGDGQSPVPCVPALVSPLSTSFQCLARVIVQFTCLLRRFSFSPLRPAPLFFFIQCPEFPLCDIFGNVSERGPFKVLVLSRLDSFHVRSSPPPGHRAFADSPPPFRSRLIFFPQLVTCLMVLQCPPVGHLLSPLLPPPFTRDWFTAFLGIT